MKFFNSLGKPLVIVKNNPVNFAIWFIVVIFVGLFGFWFPLAVNILNEDLLTFKVAVFNGTITTLGIAMLIEGLITMVNVPKAGRTITTTNIRAIAILLTAILIILNFIIYAQIFYGNTTNTLKYAILIVFVFSLGKAAYLYCFRSNEWEKGVEEVYKNDDENVQNLEEKSDELNDKIEGDIRI